MQEFTTPMMKQYKEIRKKYPDCLLFYRMGDFYELFLEDAHIGSRVLGITLTSRAKGRDGRIPMAGVPYHAVDAYLFKLVKAGYKVAICEQLTEPNSKGIIERDVVRIVTPGTVLDETALDKKENNYLVAISTDTYHIGFAYADISTGQFFTTQLEYTNLEQTLADELTRFHPTECILPPDTYADTQFLRILKSLPGLNIFPFNDWDTYGRHADKTLKSHFGVSTLAGFGIDHLPHAMTASAALLGYLLQTQKHTIAHIQSITTVDPTQYLLLDRSTIINLELYSTLRDHETRGTLLSIMDKTVTAMGGRLLRQWMNKPLTQKEAIETRYDALQELIAHPSLHRNVRKNLEQILDIERTLSRISVGIGNARDFIALKESLHTVLQVKMTLQGTTTSLLRELCAEITPKLQELIDHINTTIVDDPPVSVKDGGIICSSVNERLDWLRSQVGGGKEWITKLEQTERLRTGITSLKVRYNQVFGFYIEVSKSNVHLVPKEYMRKQTLVGGERFITPELKVKEEMILTAQDEMNKLEYVLFEQTVRTVLQYVADIANAAKSIASIDCLCCFAQIAQTNHYVRPILLYSGELRIKDGRHPVVETLLEETPFVPNSVTIDPIHQQLLVITGPNMAGKSVFIRQVALIVLMAQMGSFVSASQAHISLVDRIFVRSGASDIITSGLSTFMVEMVETAYILHHMTQKSLIIMDEIGRGTSTYDGISIAWAIAQYLVTHTTHPAKTLFATHYHELQALEEQYPNKIKNMHMAVVEEHGNPIFLHTLLVGGASSSYGVAVAKLAGIPDLVIERAKELLATLERHQHDVLATNSVSIQNEQSFSQTKEILEVLAHLDISRMTPLEAMNTLAMLQEKLM